MSDSIIIEDRLKIWMGRHSDHAVWYCESPFMVDSDNYFKVLNDSSELHVFARAGTDGDLMNYIITTLVPDRKTVYEIDL